VIGDHSGLPVVAAPMAGGPSTTDLVVAVTEAGALGFVAGGYTSARSLAEEIRAVRARTTRPFGVNLFVPGAPTRAAGAHRSAFDDAAPDDELSTLDLVAAIRALVSTAIVAARGI
jgi:nitronate monooxygenase